MSWVGEVVTAAVGRVGRVSEDAQRERPGHPAQKIFRDKPACPEQVRNEKKVGADGGAACVGVVQRARHYRIHLVVLRESDSADSRFGPEVEEMRIYTLTYGGGKEGKGAEEDVVFAATA